MYGYILSTSKFLGDIKVSDEGLEEFMEIASTNVKKGRRRRGDSTPDDDFKEERAKDEKAGAPVQYSYVGPGFLPTTRTTKALPPGCYRIEAYGQVVIFAPKKIITDSLLKLPDSKSEEVVREVEEFWTLKPLFKKYGFSHKRGLLLWGPAGSGKTCAIAQIIVKMVKAGNLVLLADHPGLLSQMLYSLRSVEPDRPLVVVWEDLDTVIENHGEAEVLAVLDGEAQIDNVVFIATTNYPEKLDSRIVNRPSRFDRIVKIDMPNEAARGVYLKAKLGHTDVTEDGVKIDLVKETKGLSIAHLRELIVGAYCQKSKVREVLTRLQKMKQKPKSGFESEGNGLGI